VALLGPPSLLMLGLRTASTKVGSADDLLDHLRCYSGERYFESSTPRAIVLAGVLTNVDIDKSIWMGALDKGTGKVGPAGLVMAFSVQLEVRSLPWDRCKSSFCPLGHRNRR
jgi:hypothetical protein